MEIPFTDELTFQVVPVFENTDGSYTYPDANDEGKWRTTNPRPEIAAIREKNAVYVVNKFRTLCGLRLWMV